MLELVGFSAGSNPVAVSVASRWVLADGSSAEAPVVYSGGTSIFKEADLAIVALNKPIKSVAPTVKLARTAVRRGERIVMVGYGFGSTEKGAKTYGNRHFAESVVVEVNGSDSRDVKFDVREEPRDGGIPSGIYGGDSGGPCFSKSDEAMLVGIATAVTSHDERKKLSVFTSVSPHREWVARVAREQGETVH